MDRMTRWTVVWLFAALVIAPIGRAQDAVGTTVKDCHYSFNLLS